MPASATPQQAFLEFHAATRQPGVQSAERAGENGRGLLVRSRLQVAEQDRLAKYASDHFPIGAEID